MITQMMSFGANDVLTSVLLSGGNFHQCALLLEKVFCCLLVFFDLMTSIIEVQYNLSRFRALKVSITSLELHLANST